MFGWINLKEESTTGYLYLQLNVFVVSMFPKLLVSTSNWSCNLHFPE